MPNNPAASPTVSSTVGLKNMVIAPLTVDTEETLTYGDLQLVAGAIEATITPDNADPDIQYADDIEFDVLYPDPELTFTTKMADIPLAIQEKIFGNEIDDNGVLIRTSTDKPPYFRTSRSASRVRSPTASSAMCGCIRCGRSPSLRTTPPRKERPSTARPVRWSGPRSNVPTMPGTRRLPTRVKTASPLRAEQPSSPACIRPASPRDPHNPARRMAMTLCGGFSFCDGGIEHDHLYTR